MKFNPKTSKNYNTNVQNSIDYHIGDQGAVFNILMDKLYTNNRNTLVQEYLSNARDANRDNNSKSPIEVTLPNTLSPVMIIKDSGKGLSPEGMKTFFASLGSSSKRSDDTQTGGYGIGCKSYFSYGDSFTIISHHEGKKSIYVANRTNNPQSPFSLGLMGEGATSETGLEIQLPVKLSDLQVFIMAVYRTCLFWEKERPVLKGILKDEIPSFYKDFKPLLSFGNYNICYLPKIFDNFKQENQYNSSTQEIAVVDGIPFNAESFVDENCFNAIASDPAQKGSLTFVMNFKTGEVEIPANREEIAKTPKNIKTIQESSQNLLKAYISYHKRLMNKVSDKEAISIGRGLLNNLRPNADLAELLNNFSVNKETFSLSFRQESFNTSRYRSMEHLVMYVSPTSPDITFETKLVERKSARTYPKDILPAFKILKNSLILINDSEKDNRFCWNEFSQQFKKSYTTSVLTILKDSPLSRELFSDSLYFKSITKKNLFQSNSKKDNKTTNKDMISYMNLKLSTTSGRGWRRQYKVVREYAYVEKNELCNIDEEKVFYFEFKDKSYSEGFDESSFLQLIAFLESQKSTIVAIKTEYVSLIKNKTHWISGLSLKTDLLKHFPKLEKNIDFTSYINKQEFASFSSETIDFLKAIKHPYYKPIENLVAGDNYRLKQSIFGTLGSIIRMNEIFPKKDLEKITQKCKKYTEFLTELEEANTFLKYTDVSGLVCDKKAKEQLLKIVKMPK